jgi:poly(beta-D-mannuronate) lyase
MTATILKAALASASLLTASAALAHDHDAVPASKFDLSHWKITVPLDENGDKKPDEISVKGMQKYSHPDFFFLDNEGRMTFAAPNKATTTANSSNTRSELRQMLRGTNTRIKTHAAKNNFAVEARKDSNKFGSIGGKMEATLRVDHVARNAGNPDKNPAYSVVVGQIHATKYDSTRSGFGYGNEPIKIYYKKRPGHETGSVFWTYELNLAKDNPDRRDIAFPAFGNLWDNDAEPGEKGISLGEEFSYTINVHKNMMYLTFSNERLGTVNQKISLVRGVNEKDNKFSYGGDTLYFKAGAYNQCSTKNTPGFWYAACAGTGDWETDKANGDYTQVSFSRLVVGASTAEE